jgi:cysteine desulfurase
MQPFLTESYGNPSSLHEAGRISSDAVETARRQVADCINSKPRRIIFTGGGTESDNLAIKGVALANREKGKHIITTSIEHPAVLETCRFLERMGYEITRLDVDRYGCVRPEAVSKAITPETILVSIMMANNEVGTILPIRELCAAVHEKGVLFHTDAVQAVGKLLYRRLLQGNLVTIAGDRANVAADLRERLERRESLGCRQRGRHTGRKRRPQKMSPVHV